VCSPDDVWEHPWVPFPKENTLIWEPPLQLMC
jgi:hypothetical protein